MQEAWAYVDPGTGFVFAQNTSFFWSICLSLLTLFLLPLRRFFAPIKRFFWFLIAVMVSVIVIGIISEVFMNKGEKRKVVVLGIDAMDAAITDKLMAEGRLPNLAALKSRGSFSRLNTTLPAESVVAWTSFLTGLAPADHGVFDFVMRDPKTYMPYLSLDEIATDSGRPVVKRRRKGEAFWDILSKNDVPSFVYFCPNTFPPQRLSGKMFSGMGVPDLLGMTGKFSFYTAKPLLKSDEDSRGRIIPLVFKDREAKTFIYGPKASLPEGVSELKIPMNITMPVGSEKVCLEFQREKFLLGKGEWSAWKSVVFKTGFFKSIRGIVRLYLRSSGPDLELYVSPINFDPRRPVFPVSYPDSASARLVKSVGLYYTQGMPYDTWALTEGRLDEQAFLELANEILDEGRRILFDGLRDFKHGVFFFYFETLDPVQHMFWRYIDPKHPLYEKDSQYAGTIDRYYEKMDAVVGEVLSRLDPGTTLIVFSDHGFNGFRRAVNLNRWLLDEGYLVLENGASESREFFEHVDWQRTKAYALGFGEIYLNRIGREAYGIVDDKAALDLKRDITEGLRQLKDPQEGQAVVRDVYSQEDVFNGACHRDAPDLFIGFENGYRASWQTALGGVPKAVIEDNKKKWSGDHLVDPSLVDGVFFVNRKSVSSKPSLTDIVPTILSIFDIAQPVEMKGRGLICEQE